MADVSKITLPNGDEYNIKDIYRGLQIVLVINNTTITRCTDQAGNNISLLDLPSFLAGGAILQLIKDDVSYLFSGDILSYIHSTVPVTQYGFFRYQSFGGLFKGIILRIRDNDGSLYSINEYTKDQSNQIMSLISPLWTDITTATSPTSNTTRYTGKEIHCIANDVDISLSNNGISSTQYAGIYVQDGEKNNIGKCAVDIYNTGMVEMQLYAQNKGTGSNVSNYLSLQVANDGTKSISVNAPVAWRQAIGPELLTSSPSSFSNKTISTGGSWTNLGSQAFPKGGLYLVLYTVRWDEVTSGSSITAGKGYRKTCIASTPTGGPTSNQHLCLGPSTPTDDTVQEMTCVIDTLSAANNQTQYFQCAQTSGYSMTAMGRYTIIRLI